MAGTPERVPSLARLRRQYPTEEACRRLLEEFRWPQRPFCPHCGSYAHWDLTGPSGRPGLKECRDCRGQYTVIRTMMDDRDAEPLSGIVEIDLKYLGGGAEAPKGRPEVEARQGHVEAESPDRGAKGRSNAGDGGSLREDRGHQGGADGRGGAAGDHLQRQGSHLPERHPGLRHGPQDGRP